MNLDRVQALAAIVLSILVHVSVAVLGNFKLGEAGSVAGSLSVSISGYTTPAMPQSSEDALSESVDWTESLPNSASDIEPSTDPVTPKAVAVTEDPPVQEYVEVPADDKPVKQPIRKAEATAKPVARLERKASSESVKRKSTAVVSFIEAKKKPPVSKLQAATPSNEAQQTQMTSIYKSDQAGRAAANGIIAAIKPEVTAIPLYYLIPKPTYPTRSRDLGEAGTVIVAILVATDGRVADAYVSKTSGYPLLDGSALSTVKAKWRFKPAINRGKAVASWVRVPINFNIK